jgi:hypothetical protein
MKILCYLPIHYKTYLIQTVVEDIKRQILPEEVSLSLVVIGNKDCYKERPSFLEDDVIYYYSEEIRNVTDARNFIFKKTNFDINFFCAHDIDDMFVTKHSLSYIINPILKNPELVMSFGKSRFIGDKQIFKYLYPNFLPQEELSNNIKDCKNYLKRTSFFPTQSTLYSYNIVKELGGYPNSPSMEDRLLTLKIFDYAIKNNKKISFCNQEITNYTIHKKSLSYINENNGSRDSIRKEYF